MMENLAQKQTNTGKKPMTNKKAIHIDMTPMVDLGFLLITFFMLATHFSKPNVMDLGLPAKSPTPTNTVIDFRNQITFLIGKDNRIFYYQAESKDLIKNVLRETTFEGNQIAKIIAHAKKTAPKPDIFTVIIKPTDDSSYKNFVDMLDNMAITQNERYGISDIKPIEKGIYMGAIEP
ncbi:ExbD/TolR family protein [Chryseobacterium koreense]